jgi:reverse gyrase
MQLAQDLFETAFITYHRTDSIRVSSVGIEVAKEYINSVGKGNYFQPRKWGEGGAHECIRPTSAVDVDELLELIEERGITNIGEDHLKLYDLIFRRFIASQMKPAKVKVTTYEIEFMGRKLTISGVTEVVDPSFLEFYWPLYLKKVPNLEYLEEKPEEIRFRLDSEYKLYTQGTLIAEMRKRGIGRPSTYATIVKKLLDKSYIYETKEGLAPSKLGREVFNYLYTNYKKFVSEDRTRELEKKMDLAEKGKVDYISLLKSLYEEIKEIENERSIQNTNR